MCCCCVRCLLLLLFSEQSLEWESSDQFCVWQLLSVEGPDPSLVIPSRADMNNKSVLIAKRLVIFFLLLIVDNCLRNHNEETILNG